MSAKGSRSKFTRGKGPQMTHAPWACVNIVESPKWWLFPFKPKVKGYPQKCTHTHTHLLWFADGLSPLAQVVLEARDVLGGKAENKNRHRGSGRERHWLLRCTTAQKSKSDLGPHCLGFQLFVSSQNTQKVGKDLEGVINLWLANKGRVPLWSFFPGGKAREAW